MKKCLLAMLLCFFAVAFAVGCGADNPSSDGEKSNSNGTTDVNGKNDNSNTETQSKLAYEITDTGFKFYTNSREEVVYSAYVEIANTGGCDIYMDKCVFDFEDNDGHLLQSDDNVYSFSSVVSPGEKGYFFNYIGSSTIDKGVSLDNGIKLVPQVKLTEAKDKPVSYPVSDVSVRMGDSNEIKIIGRIENTSDKNADYVFVNVVFYDTAGKAIAVSGGSVKNIEAGMKSGFEVSIWGTDGILKLEDIADTKVVAEEIYIQK
ncbi:MAG: FxLYD domain-containing protein [Paludibacteraceae bacterium]|nr:FxLYD domain-containing protein [Paludibacteraceae bacterium]